MSSSSPIRVTFLSKWNGTNRYHWSENEGHFFLPTQWLVNRLSKKALLDRQFINLMQSGIAILVLAVGCKIHLFKIPNTVVGYNRLQQRTLQQYICLDRLLEYCIVKIRIESIDATTQLSTTCVSIPSWKFDEFFVPKFTFKIWNFYRTSIVLPEN